MSQKTFFALGIRFITRWQEPSWKSNLPCQRLYRQCVDSFFETSRRSWEICLNERTFLKKRSQLVFPIISAHHTFKVPISFHKVRERDPKTIGWKGSKVHSLKVDRRSKDHHSISGSVLEHERYGFTVRMYYVCLEAAFCSFRQLSLPSPSICFQWFIEGKERFFRCINPRSIMMEKRQAVLSFSCSSISND